MAKSKGSANASMKFMGIFFALVGFVIVGVSIKFFYDNVTYEDRYDSVSALITRIYTRRDSDGDKHHDVYVSYTYEGKAYTDVELNLYSSGMREGGRYTIYIDPAEPYSPKTKQPVGVCVLLLLFGGVFAVVGTSIFKGSLSSGSPKLKETGVPVIANVTKSGFSGTRINHRHTYHVKAEYTDMNGNLRKVKTGLLNFDPTPFVMANGNKITVYVDQNKPKKYYIDTDEMYQYISMNMMQNMAAMQSMGMMNPGMMMGQGMGMMNQGMMNYNQQNFNQQQFNQQNYNQNYDGQNFGNGYNNNDNNDFGN